MKSIIVQKYGGVCLATPEKIKQVARSVAELSEQGHGVVVVVSAMGDTTDQLINLAHEVSVTPNRRELDMLLTVGERVSMALVGMALHDLGQDAISFTGSQAGVMTDDSHSNARIVDIRPIRVLEELDRGRIIVLAGFQGVNPETKEITTLGRGGTDTTAVAMAAKLKADRCEIVKEVDGICTADPRIVPAARRLPTLTYSELREMCFWGAKVLHYRAIALAEELNIPLRVCRSGASTATDVVKEISKMEEGRILSVNSHQRIEHIGVEAPTLNKAFMIFEEHLANLQIPRPHILASAYENGVARLMLTGDQEGLNALIRSIEDRPGLRAIKAPLSSITLTCRGSVGTDLAARVMARLERDQIAADKVLFTPLSISVCVLPAQREAAVRALHSFVSE